MKNLNKKEISIGKALLLILLLSLLNVGIQAFIQIGNSTILLNYIKCPLLILFNLIPIFLCITLLYFSTNNICLSYSVTSVILFIMVTVNHYKVFFRSEPFVPTDFNLVNEAFNIVKNYSISVSPKLIISLIAIILVSVILGLFIKSKHSKWYLRVTGVVISIALILTSVKFIYHNQELYDNLNVNDNSFDEVNVCTTRGFLYNFLYKTTSVMYTEPKGYDIKDVKATLNNYGKDFDKNQEMPNIIGIMSEAFFDPAVAKNIEYYKGKDPMKDFNKLREESLYGTIVVPGFAGGTFATEFEFLSGDNLFLLDPALPIVYKTHITKDMYCLPTMLNDMGFRSIAIHPGEKWFYKRDKVYKKMGFSEFTTKDDLPNDVEKVNWYVSDKVTSDLIIDKYKEHLKKYPDKNYFNFTVTIQNHGPYISDKMLSDPYFKPIDGLSDELYTVVNNYMYGLEDAVALVKDVTDYANTLDKPTVVVFFGDHLPYFDGDFIAYDKIGMNFEKDDIDTMVRKHSTPFIIWSNDAEKERLNKKGSEIMEGNYGTISSNFLSMLMLQKIDMDMPPFYDYVNNIFKDIKIMGQNYYSDGKKYMTELSPALQDKIQGYKYLQYYNMRNFK